jgi:hypothetical protein
MICGTSNVKSVSVRSSPYAKPTVILHRRSLAGFRASPSPEHRTSIQSLAPGYVVTAMRLETLNSKTEISERAN